MLTLIAQSAAFAPPRVQVPDGSWSVSVTSCAAPGPWLVRVMVKVATSPALSGPLPLLTTSRSGHWTMTDALSELEPSLPVVTVAVLLIVPQSVGSVAPETWTVKLSVGAMLASSQTSDSLPTAPVIEQVTPVVSPLIAPRTQSTPAGSESVTWTLMAVPSPTFETVMSQPIGSPALTGPTGLASLMSRMSAQRTSIEPVSELLPAWAARSFVAPTVAVFGMLPQSWASVSPETFTVALAPDAMSPKLQERTSVPTGPLIEQDVLSSDQSIPPGRLSVRVTFRAMPGPRLLTTIVKVARLPALTSPPSGVLTTVTSGHWTTTEAVAVSLPSFEVVTLAVLLTVPQSAGSVGPEMRALKLAPAARLALVQPRTSVPTGPVMAHEAPPVTVPRVQSTPGGSGSLTATLSAVPVPVLVTVISKPIGSPALTGPAGLATLAMSMVAGATVKHSVVAFVWLAGEVLRGLVGRVDSPEAVLADRSGGQADRIGRRGGRATVGRGRDRDGSADLGAARRAAGRGDLGGRADEERDGARGRAVIAGQRRGVGHRAAEVDGRVADLGRDRGRNAGVEVADERSPSAEPSSTSTNGSRRGTSRSRERRRRR